MSLSPRQALLYLWPVLLHPASARAQGECRDVENLPNTVTWTRLLHIFHSHPCDDGASAEALDDIVVHGLATRWGELPRLARLTTSDTAFRAFVLRHITATASEAELASIDRLAQEQCPAGLTSFCADLRRRAADALPGPK
jgi:hypothetical protein